MVALIGCLVVVAGRRVALVGILLRLRDLADDVRVLLLLRRHHLLLLLLLLLVLLLSAPVVSDGLTEALIQVFVITYADWAGFLTLLIISGVAGRVGPRLLSCAIEFLDNGHIVALGTDACHGIALDLRP